MGGESKQQQKLQKEAVSQDKIYIFISRQQAHMLQGRARQGPSEPIWRRAVSIEACFLVRKLQGCMGRFKYKQTHHAGQGPGPRAQVSGHLSWFCLLGLYVLLSGSLHLQVTETE